MTQTRKIAIIGVGPRGSFALENYISILHKKNALSRIELLLFERTGNFGNGQIYDTQQTRNNWFNVAERIMELEARKELQLNEITIPGFPSYLDWISESKAQKPTTDADHFPPRAKLGNYLRERFDSLSIPLQKANIITLHTELVTNVAIAANDSLTVSTDLTTYENINEVLLTIGHQSTAKSDEIKKWEAFAENNKELTLFTSAYPISDIITHRKLSPESTIGLRGFGLSMIDVVRAVSHHFGNFSITDEQLRTCTYHSAYELSDLFIPFSLEGLPPVPKPLTKKIDKQYEPTKAQLNEFGKIIGDKKLQKKATDELFVLEAFAPIAVAIFQKLNPSAENEYSEETLTKVVISWLQDQDFKHPLIVSLEQKVTKVIKDHIQIACDEAAVSLDYCVGQVWRHCQPTMYDKLSYNDCSDEVFAEIIALDESTKRYSYGPPVESMQQLVALIDCGTLQMDFIKDPEIGLTRNGWRIQKNDAFVDADMMIDCVLDPPKIKAVTTDLVTNMLSDDLLKVVNDDLGVVTDEFAYVVSANDTKLPIALLGRLAKGTVIGVDAILECFGNRPKKWAEKAAEKHEEFLKKNQS